MDHTGNTVLLNSRTSTMEASNVVHTGYIVLLNSRTSTMEASNMVNTGNIVLAVMWLLVQGSYRQV